MNLSDAIRGEIEPLECCCLATVRVAELRDQERLWFCKYMPYAITAVAFAHRVVTEGEWTWYAISDCHERCEADNHLKNQCVKVKRVLEEHGHVAELVPYPGRSGLRFRYVVEAAVLVTIGTNAFLFHPERGPCVHLRIIGTSANTISETGFDGLSTAPESHVSQRTT